MLLRNIIQWTCYVLGVLSGLIFLSRNESNHRPHDLMGALGYFLVALLIQLYWK